MEAYFVGKAQVIESTLFDTPRTYKVKLIQPYTNDRAGIINVNVRPTSCAKEIPHYKDIYEDIIIKDEGGFYFSDQNELLTNEAWEALRSKAKPSEEIETAKKACLDKGAQWGFSYRGLLNIFDCYYEAK